MAWITLRSIALALPLLAGALAPASAETLQGPAAAALALRNEVQIDGNLVRLGDLFDGPLQDAGRPVAEAPAPGQSVTLDATWLAALARAIALPWQPASRFDQIRVSRRGQAIESGTVRIALMQALAQRGLGGELGIEFDGSDPRLILPMGAEPTVAVERLTFDPLSGRFAAAIAAPATGPAEATLTISGRAYAMVEVPVLKQRLAPGDTITEADIDWISMPSDRVASGIVTELADLAGKTPRRPIKPQQPVRNTDLVDAVAVARGSLVTVMLDGANMSLTVQGKALQNGAVGDTVRVVNTMSNRTLDAVVVSPSRVAVMLPTSIAQGE